jgi:hypothetical protein
MNDELEMIWKEACVICLDKLRKRKKNSNQGSQCTSQYSNRPRSENYRHTILFSKRLLTSDERLWDIELKSLFLRCYLMTLSMSRVSSISDAMINGFGTIVGKRQGRRNHSTRTEPTPLPHSLLKYSCGLIWDRSRGVRVVSLRLTAWAMALR